MQTPLALELNAPRGSASVANAAAQVQTLRLPGAAWTALLSALALDPREPSLPGTATVVAGSQPGIYYIEYAGRVAGFAWPQRLAVGSVLHFTRLPGEAMPAAASPPAPAIVDSTRVSETVETLSRLLDRAFREPPRPFPLAMETAGAMAAPQRFAAALANAVSGSGVFFEAHLADWVRGKRSLALVRAEAESRSTAPVRTADAPQRSVATSEAALQQQLSMLVTNELAFQFAAWPGQPASLALGPAAEDGGNDAAPEREFVARLHAELRGLGPVHATLGLTPHGIDLALRAESPQTAAAMRKGLAALAEAFTAAGLRVGRIEVSHERHE